MTYVGFERLVGVEPGNEVVASGEEAAIRAIDVEADIILRGCQVMNAALQSRPYIVPKPILVQETLGRQDWAGVEVEAREGMEQMLDWAYERMSRRAEFQRTVYDKAPTQFKQRLFGDLKARTTLGEMKFNPKRCGIQFGLFTYGIVAEDDQFEMLAQALGLGEAGDATGFVTAAYRNEFGPIPVLRRKDRAVTGMHEEVHVIQQLLADQFGFGVAEEGIEGIGDVAVRRATRQEGITPGDYRVCLDHLQRAIRGIGVQLDHEMQASLWEGEEGRIKKTEERERNEIYLLQVALWNVIYAEVLGLSSGQRLEAVYRMILKTALPEYRRAYIYQCGHQAVAELGKSWEWVGAHTLVIPVQSPLELYRAVLLSGESLSDTEALGNYQREVASRALAVAAVGHARRMSLPDPFGEGGTIPVAHREEFDNNLQTARELAHQVGQEVWGQGSWVDWGLFEETYMSYARLSVSTGE